MTDAVFTDFAQLALPDRPNRWLVAPMDHHGVRARPDQPAPVYGVAAPPLAEAWRTVVEAEPRTDVVAVSADGLRIEATQRSALFGFTDDISAMVIPLEPAADGTPRSTVAVYSRSRLGYWDLGVNRERLQSWLTKLEQNVSNGR